MLKMVRRKDGEAHYRSRDGVGRGQVDVERRAVGWGDWRWRRTVWR